MMHVLLIGLGQALRGDDGVGPLVTRLVRDKAGIDVVDYESTSSLLTAAWSQDDHVIIVDAAYQPELVTGSLLQFFADANLRLPSSPYTSSHGLNLAAALELVRILGRMPRELAILVIVGENFAPLAPMTPVVRAAAEGLAQRFVEGWTPWQPLMGASMDA